jgi:hypothetical protein
MRILMTGPTDLLAMRRPLDWVVRQGHEVWLVGNRNSYEHHMPGNVRWFPSIAQQVNATRGWQVEDSEAADVRLGTLQLRLLAARFQPEVIHAHYVGIETSCAVRSYLKPLIVSVWGALNRFLRPAGKQEDFPPTIRRIFEAAQALIVETPHLIEPSRTWRTPPPRVELIPLGVDPQRFRPSDGTQRTAWRRSLGIPAETLVLLSPRGWGKTYNQDQILTAYTLARPQCREPTLLAFLKLGRNSYQGEAEALYRRTQQRAEELGLVESVR